MKLIYIRYNTIFMVLIVTLLIIVSILFAVNYSRKTNETFFNDDIYYKGTKEEKIMAFACNVDWGNECIPHMLQIFDNYEIKITFFPTGRWAEKNPELLKKIFEKGHEIGNHGYFHKDYNLLNYEDNRKEIEKADIIITEIIGTKAKYFAPPSGAYNNDTIKAAKDLGYKIIMWSIDTIDWNTKDYTKILERVNKKIHNGAIILMHPTESTVKALPIMINDLIKNNYKIVPVSEVIKTNN